MPSWHEIIAESSDTPAATPRALSPPAHERAPSAQRRAAA
jgi:hypothetical protein